MIKNTISISFFLALGLLWSCHHETVDLVLRNGTIVDGTGRPSYSGDVAIHSDTLFAIGKLNWIRGSREIDVGGMVVAPGFINMLSWANESLIEDGRSQSDIRQGVTLEVLGEGFSMGPLNDELKRIMKEEQDDIVFDVSWTTLGEYLEFLTVKGVSPNIASFVGNATLRQYTMGYENREPSDEEMTLMKSLLREAMEEGAVGLSSALIYVPSGHAQTDELIELASVVSEYDGLYISHIRGEEHDLLSAVDELLQTAREADVRSEIYHFKASGSENWHLLDSAILMIEQARAEGLQITTDMYTYNASSTGLNIGLPSWAREGGHDATMNYIRNPVTRKRMIQENKFHVSPDKILLVGFRNPEMRRYLGWTLEEVMEERETSSSETAIDLIYEDDSRIQVVYFSMSEENIKKKIALPWMSICSDAGSYATEGVFLKQSTHPRAYGSFARVLGKFVRDEGVISIEEGIYKMTGLPASNLKLKKRGLLKTGYYADVVVFDASAIRDHATFEDPHQYSTGVQHVWVNGQQVLRDGDHTGALPGRVVRGPGYVE
ncbi:MAG: D-aminoacylase [Cyclobacteriaceae bacterium]|jgi:N-acyl-D-amino-acid deacylase